MYTKFISEFYYYSLLVDIHNGWLCGKKIFCKLIIHHICIKNDNFRLRLTGNIIVITNFFKIQVTEYIYMTVFGISQVANPLMQAVILTAFTFGVTKLKDPTAG